MKFVLDTNFYLHYKLFTGRDWKTKLGSDNLTLIVPPVVIEELDEKKYSAPDARIKRRAQEVISKFKDISEGESAPLGFQINFLESNIEDVDWGTLRLNPSNSDDRIIAAMLALKEQTPDEEILIVTADLGLQFKAKNHNIKVLSPPADWKRESKDPRDKEIAKLRAQNQKYQNALPDVQLLLSTGDELLRVLKISKAEMLKDIMTDEDVKERLDQESKELESIGEGNLILGSYRNFTKKEIKSYDLQLRQYMKKYSDYLNDVKKIQEFSLKIEISPILMNNGSIPAEDIDIYLSFPNEWLNNPEDIKLLKEADLLEFPEKPTRPAPPQPFSLQLERFTRFPSLSSLISQPISPYVNSGPIKQIGPEINESGMSVHYWLRNLKHGMNWPLEPVYIWYLLAEFITSFQIEYSIHISNHPDIKEGKLDVVIEN